MFFQPVFNVADAAISVSVILLILFYARYLADGKTGDDNEAKTAEKPETDETPQE